MSTSSSSPRVPYEASLLVTGVSPVSLGLPVHQRNPRGGATHVQRQDNWSLLFSACQLNRTCPLTTTCTTSMGWRRLGPPTGQTQHYRDQCHTLSWNYVGSFTSLVVWMKQTLFTFCRFYFIFFKFAIFITSWRIHYCRSDSVESNKCWICFTLF